jgi:hypothetical protein
MPATVGYQPTLFSEVAEIEERIVSTNVGAITSVQTVYVPADDLTDQAVEALFAHLDTIVILSRAQATHRTAGGGRRYIALPGGVLSFRDGLLTIATRRYLCDDDLERIRPTPLR